MWPFRREGSRDPFEGMELPPLHGPSWRDLRDRLVPDRGQADTVQGELLRAAGRVSREHSANGCMNWNADFDRLCDFASDHLADGTFNRRVSEYVRKAFADMKTLGRWYAERDALEDEEAIDRMNEEGPTSEPEDGAIDRMEQLAELWCRAHPDGIRRKHDPDLAI
jgi:hypothetical protein